MLISRFLCSILCAGVVFAAGCKSSDKSPIADDRARFSKQLEIPPDLAATSSIPSASATAAAEQQGGQVLPNSQGIHSEIRNDGDRRWLAVDADADMVWKRLQEYWSTLGVSLVVNRPVDGVMETNWISSAGTTDKPGLANLLNLLSVDKPFHKYRIRLERAGDNKTNLYAAHRTTTKTEISYARRESEYEWVEKTGDPEREIEVLQALSYAFDPASMLSPG